MHFSESVLLHPEIRKCNLVMVKSFVILRLIFTTMFLIFYFFVMVYVSILRKPIPKNFEAQ